MIPGYIGEEEKEKKEDKISMIQVEGKKRYPILINASNTSHSFPIFIPAKSPEPTYIASEELANAL